MTPAGDRLHMEVVTPEGNYSSSDCGLPGTISRVLVGRQPPCWFSSWCCVQVTQKQSDALLGSWICLWYIFELLWFDKWMYGKHWWAGVCHNAHTMNIMWKSVHTHRTDVTRTTPTPSLSPFSLSSLPVSHAACLHTRGNNVHSRNGGLFPGCLFVQWSFREP